MSEEASELFCGLVFDGGTPAATCELCDREHYNLNGEYMDEGELKSFERKYKRDPQKYVPHDGQVHIGEIGGKQVVYGCECGRLKNYEDFIWSHRRMITSYIQKRAESERKEAQETELAADAAGAAIDAQPEAGQ